MDKKVELQVINITNSQAQVGAFAMLLDEAAGVRKIANIVHSLRITIQTVKYMIFCQRRKSLKHVR